MKNKRTKPETATELEYLRWILANINLGPADDDVFAELDVQFTEETGKVIPDKWPEDRAAECVNACKGIASPAEFVARARQLKQQAENALDLLGPCGCNSCVNPCPKCRLRVAINLLPGAPND